MQFGIKTKTKSFYELFALSGQHLVQGIDLFNKLVGAKFEDRAALRDEIHKVEHSADETNHAIARKLNETFVTPFDRDDISMLASCLDTCMDYIDEAADFIVLYKIGDLPVRINRLTNVLQRCADLTADAMPKLKTLDSLRDYWVEINRLENEGDQTYRKLLSELFESGLDTLTIIKLKDIIESLEKAVDSFERLATVVETIAIKES